ncbi:hypothetical protein DSCW_38290 [Desulfosarcina widdelii]|uniref:Uncharacterized protein n=1 Tax=Desulfosarcina widdelii TaxID=947919 RepID=A0A5K7Z315_9BACT|nr:hypothetical protein [Desulfosarcina widdelii]BBO76412.1 hypothetical protein DSCW_38290 [Desulfosarcina widdelii]
MSTITVIGLHNRRWLSGTIVLAALLLMLTACGSHYGNFSLSGEVTHAFETGTVQPDLDYYYAGRDTMPYAIMGIDRRYQVPSRYWIPFDPQPEQLKKMSGNIYGKDRYDPYGAHIRDTEGKIIGIWYSNVRFKSVSVDQQNMTVEVLFPNPENDDRPGIAAYDL